MKPDPFKLPSIPMILVSIRKNGVAKNRAGRSTGFSPMPWDVAFGRDVFPEANGFAVTTKRLSKKSVIGRYNGKGWPESYDTRYGDNDVCVCHRAQLKAGLVGKGKPAAKKLYFTPLKDGKLL